MPTLKNSTRGFTLIELLVVITIIGILATLGVSQFTAQLQKTRDSKRISDVEKIKWAIESYNLDKTEFPDPTSMSTFTWGVQPYLPVIPLDPKTTTGSGQTCAKTTATTAANATKCEYAYNAWPDANGVKNNAFVLTTAFESVTNLDVQANNAKDKGTCSERLEIGTQYSKQVGQIDGQELNAKCKDGDGGIYIK